jgi:hypothetical protein
MLFDAALLALIVGRLAGGRLRRLGDLPLRCLLCFVAAFALQLAVKLGARAGWHPALAAAPYAHLASYLLLGAGLAANWHLRDLRLLAFGVGLNFLVIAANLGYMPTDLRAVKRLGHPQMAADLARGRTGLNVVADAHSRLAFLGDRFLLPRPYPRPSVFSLGDVIITLGACLLILRGMGAFGLRPPSPPRPAETT